MLTLKLSDKHTNGCHVFELFRQDDGQLEICVYDNAGGHQFNYDLDESDLEILSILIERARDRLERKGRDE